MVLPTVELRGLEAICGVIPKYNCMIAHVMLLEGPVEPLLHHLPLALARVFNRFPRMRLKQSKDDAFQAHWFPADVTCDVIQEQEYFKMVHVPAVKHEDAWKQIVQDQCEECWDRTTKFPYYLHALVEKCDDMDTHLLTQVRLVLYSDHYMSDATSGYIILDALLHEASSLTRSSTLSTSHKPSEEQPFPHSVYKICCVWTNWKSLLVWILVKLFVKPLLRISTAAYHQVLPIEESQKDFVIGEEAVQNKSFALFQSGKAENLTLALKKCREENVTLYGAFAACVVAAFAGVTEKVSVEKAETPIRMTLNFAYDARKRLGASLPAKAVGCYALSGGLESFGQEGVMLSTKFWDLARRAKQETEQSINGVKSLVGLCVVDEMAKIIGLNRMPGFTFPRCINSDTIISNTGAYPFKTRHELVDPEVSGTSKAWTVKSIFNYSCGPTMSSCCSIWITSVQSLNYTMMYKIEHKSAAQYFEILVKCFESIGRIETEETVDQVARRLLRK